MKKTNEIYYTVTERQWPDCEHYWYESITSFNTGQLMVDRKAAIDYILNMKSNYPDYSYKLSLRIRRSQKLELELLLIDCIKTDIIEQFIHEEVSVIKYNYPLDNKNTYELGKYTFMQGSQLLNELTLKYQFEVAGQEGDLSKLKELFNLYGNRLINFVLIIAIYNGHLEIVKYCCSNGADPTMDNYYPIKVAIEVLNVDITSYLLENAAGWQTIAGDILIAASKASSAEILEMLFRKTNFSTSDIITAMKYSDEYGGIVTLQHLINKVEVYPALICEQIMIAANNENFDAVNFLIEFRSDLSSYTYDLMKIAAEYGKLDIIEKVFKYQNIELTNCVSVLNVAVRYGRSKIVKFLIKKGVVFTEDTVSALVKVFTEGIEEPGFFTCINKKPNMVFLIDHIISKSPGYGPQLAKFFTEAQKQRHPFLATGVDFNLF